MTGRRPSRSAHPGGLRRRFRATRTGLLSAGALVACASLAAGCGVVPGTTGGSGDDPITVMTWAPQDTGATNKPGMPALAQAYARWINDRGGLDGRRLNVLTCNDHNDSVAAAKCARRAVKENAVAVVGSYSQHADSFFPVLEGAGIPYIGGYGITNTEFTSPLSYPVNGGQPALLAGLGSTLARTCGPVALVRPDTIAGDQLPVLLDSGLTSGGHERARDQRAAEDATEYGGQSQRALERTTTDPEDPGCVVPVLGDRTGTFMDSFRRARAEHPEVRTATVLGSVDQTTINASGGPSGPYEGAYVTGWYPSVSDPAWSGMKKVIKEEAFGDNDIDAADAGVQTTWIAYTVLAEIVGSLGDGEVSADTVRRALDGGLKVGTGGLTPSLQWTFADKLASVGFPRLVNAEVTLQVVREGRLVSAREGAVDTTRVLQNADVN
ncbi:ABC transporter substrate-binding protein [Streptomyces parvulus]|uniref:ABC transporter substrate-binding protein n=1 Tax=Streptomyces TaxID=1883 RepID=UPI00137064DB|nr:MULTISPECIES: ABC transporter substrate-binding protein [Streptomyces]MCC9157846.1 ABC transporter substrate-binding protein [Streptomyces parvulus]MCE7690032.1 ABC transporter substrate-binding protein [Streptomyces parvulus]MZD53823.1 ABC transporter substrate-binding protein [Streptomyces sp. SID5606]WML80984.1 ABC transporter substrate-binding protein [Streptomyces sp. VNUA74]